MSATQDDYMSRENTSLILGCFHTLFDCLVQLKYDVFLSLPALHFSCTYYFGALLYLSSC